MRSEAIKSLSIKCRMICWMLHVPGTGNASKSARSSPAIDFAGTSASAAYSSINSRFTAHLPFGRGFAVNRRPRRCICGQSPAEAMYLRSIAGRGDVFAIDAGDVGRLRVAVVNVEAVSQPQVRAGLEHVRRGGVLSLRVCAFAERADGKQPVIADVIPRRPKIMWIVEDRHADQLAVEISVVVDPIRRLAPSFVRS